MTLFDCWYMPWCCRYIYGIKQLFLTVHICRDDAGMLLISNGTFWLSIHTVVLPVYFWNQVTRFHSLYISWCCWYISGIKRHFLTVKIYRRAAGIFLVSTALFYCHHVLSCLHTLHVDQDDKLFPAAHMHHCNTIIVMFRDQKQDGGWIFHDEWFDSDSDCSGNW